MAIQLSPHIRCCIVNNRAAFLDLSTDRYFCLAPALDEEFRLLLEQNFSTGEDRASLSNLITAGILHHAPLAKSSLKLDLPRPTSDFLSIESRRAPLSALVVAMACYHLAGRDMKSRRIARIVSSIEKKNRSIAPGSGDTLDRMVRHAADFSQVRLIAAAQDKCLVWSIALIKFLGAYNLRAHLFLGVKMEPFGAHAWVQSDAIVLSCPLEEALQYTPILVA